METQNIEIQHQNFVLHPSGSLFWTEKSVLLISDVHLGKVSHFRKFGAAVPQKAIEANFALLDQVLRFFKPESVYFLGDLFHSHMNNEWLLFEEWVLKTNVKIRLINGNHDIIPPLKYEALDILMQDERIEDDFLLTHHPEERSGLFNFCGHIHPAIKIIGKGKQSLRLPCFFKKPGQMILPAFGQFTGSYTVKPKKKDNIYVIADNTVIKI